MSSAAPFAVTLCPLPSILRLSFSRFVAAFWVRNPQERNLGRGGKAPPPLLIDALGGRGIVGRKQEFRAAPARWEAFFFPFPGNFRELLVSRGPSEPVGSGNSRLLVLEDVLWLCDGSPRFTLLPRN